MRVALLWLLGTTACVTPSAVECDDGRVCPEGKVCASVTAPDQELCVDPDQLTACEGMAPLSACLTDGRCYDGVCLPAGCGNFRTDPDEDCDDGNAAIGDGCTPTCHVEVCGNTFVDPLADELCDDGNLIGHDGCNSTCQAERLTWEQLTPSTASVPQPRNRWGHAMTYDIARGRVVMFGGMRGASTTAFENDDETWEWGGHGWVRRFPVVSPRGRSGHAMTYDPVRRRVVMFGGVVTDPTDPNRTLHFNDTWEWDGERWIQIPPTGATPAPRASHAMTYDPIRKRVVLVGGRYFDGNVPSAYNDTWVWDGTSWTELVTTGTPDAGGYGSIAFDPVRGTVIYGGVEGFVNGSTYSLSGSTWTKVATTGAYPRSTMAYDVVGQRMLAFGGTSGVASLATIRAFDGASWTNVGAIATRQQPAAALDVDRHAIVVFGGVRGDGTSSYGDTLEWANGVFGAPSQWVPPQWRSETAIANDLARGVAVLFGGQNTGGVMLADTYELDGQGWVLRSPAASPTPRAAHGLAYDSERREVVLFGGFTGSNTKLADTWVYDGETWTQKAPATSPPVRAFHSMVYDSARRRVVVFGGFNDTTGALRDTWEWDGMTWSDKTGAGPLARVNASMTYDPIRERTVLVGGQSGSILYTDTWVWDGTTWTDVTPPLTPFKSHAGFAWDAARGRAILYGGLPFDETIWSWDGARWTVDSTAGPTSRFLNVLASDPRGAGVISFGGTDNLFQHNDTWRLVYRGAEAYESCHEPVDLDGDGKSGCQDPDCWSSCNPLCLPAVTCAAGPRCGDGSCDTLETYRACPADCPPPFVCGDQACAGGETASSCPGDCS